jgi:hypothetical protein
MRRPTKAELRARHLENLSAVLGISDDGKMKVLYKQLRDIEHKGRKMAERYCNGEIETDAYTHFENKVHNSLLHLVPQDVRRNIVLNSDPRGHFLKLNDDYTRQLRDQDRHIETDWGGYGILCPEGM